MPQAHAAALPQGPYHGSNEGMSNVWTGFILVEAAAAIAFAWFNYHLALRHASPSGPVLWRSIFVTLLVLLQTASYLLLQRRLSRRIALGGPEASFLDGIRSNLAVLVQSFTFLIMVFFR
jgi:hypothetical protein